MVSHEVRTPLASVLGFTRLLLERDLPAADRQRYLEIVDAEATRLATLVSDFLDARLIEEGRFVAPGASPSTCARSFASRPK